MKDASDCDGYRGCGSCDGRRYCPVVMGWMYMPMCGGWPERCGGCGHVVHCNDPHPCPLAGAPAKAAPPPVRRESTLTPRGRSGAGKGVGTPTGKQSGVCRTKDFAGGSPDPACARGGALV